ncbi:MAG: DUF4349 domain-containing protein [Clostridiales bacterium]|jgi:iron-sulfur cluster repair protein YtfE (RIC family)|nr:DUF4349 domain-containing protein [Clostridiales bacterium]
MKRFLIIISILLSLAIFAACRRDAEFAPVYWGHVEMPAADMQMDDMDFFANRAPEPAEAPAGAMPIGIDFAPRMVIRNANLSKEAVIGEFEATKHALRQVNAVFGGFVESSNLWQSEVRRDGIMHSLHTFHITLRIPVANFDQVLAHIETLAHVRHSSEFAQDVTEQFYDMESRLASRLIEEERVLAFIDEAENLTELLNLERRLAEVRTQIQIYRGQIEHLASRAAYSTISVTLTEVLEIDEAEEDEPTLGARISTAFGDSAGGTLTFFQEAMIILAATILPMSILGLLALTIIFIIKTASKRRKRRFETIS